MNFISDKDVWDKISTDDLWIYDKLILAKKLGYNAGPAGVPVSFSAFYVIKPITNIRMMGKGASIIHITPYSSDLVPDGFFWSELFFGRHITIDYHFGKQSTTAEGFKLPGSLNKFYKWERIDYPFELPEILKPIAEKYEWLNIEIIGDRIIEVHLRYNDDFANHDAKEIWPVWKNIECEKPAGATWYNSPAEDRLGFWIK